jgi:nucleotide-binding universal stress UspA family protein
VNEYTSPVHASRDARATSAPVYVVGVDGSEASLIAARWAATRALTDGARLVLVHAYLVPAVPSVAGPIRSPELRRSTLRRAQRMVEAVRKQLPEQADIDVVTAEGIADRVLLERAAAADLLVLGARAQHRHPHARFIGTTASRCLRRAECPVVMIPAVPSARAADTSEAAGVTAATA